MNLLKIMTCSLLLPLSFSIASERKESPQESPEKPHVPYWIYESKLDLEISVLEEGYPERIDRAGRSRIQLASPNNWKPLYIQALKVEANIDELNYFFEKNNYIPDISDTDTITDPSEHSASKLKALYKEMEIFNLSTTLAETDLNVTEFLAQVVANEFWTPDQLRDMKIHALKQEKNRRNIQ